VQCAKRVDNGRRAESQRFTEGLLLSGETNREELNQMPTDSKQETYVRELESQVNRIVAASLANAFIVTQGQNLTQRQILETYEQMLQLLRSRPTA
jgi:hypothetical protein